MDTSTTKPPSPGQGMGPSTPSSKVRPEGLRPETSAAEPAPAKREESKPKGELLGADGESIPIREGFSETAGESWKRVSAAAQGLAERNPARTALTALGVGILVGAVIGAILARD